VLSLDKDGFLCPYTNAGKDALRPYFGAGGSGAAISPGAKEKVKIQVQEYFALTRGTWSLELQYQDGSLSEPQIVRLPRLSFDIP
jgi:hypothetical protein